MKRLIHFPKTRLSEVTQEFGGANRSDAVAGARQELESMRGESDAVISAGVAAAEAIATAPQAPSRFSPDQMMALLERADQIVTLAGTFGYQALDSATRGLCDLLGGLMHANMSDVPSIQVHVRAMRLLAPGSPPLAPMHQQVILAELSKILAHHNFDRASDLADTCGPDGRQTNR